MCNTIIIYCVMLIRALMLSLISLISFISTAAQSAGKFYTGPGSAVDQRCPIGTCATNCPVWQYRKGCAFNYSGDCADYTGLAVNKYFSATGGLSDTCVQSAHKVCDAGYVNLNMNSTYEGDCTPCTVVVGYYFAAPTSPSDTCAAQLREKAACGPGNKDVAYDNKLLPANCQACTGLSAGSYWTTQSRSACISAVKTTCNIYYALSDYSNPITPGTCVRCDDPPAGVYYVANTAPSATCSQQSCTADDCIIGQYKWGCCNSNPGMCKPCTNGGATQIYTSTGSYPNICQVQGCSLPCAKGEYISGCGEAGAVQSSLKCKACNNSVTDHTYYTDTGGYTYNSCPTTGCPVCPIGFYTFGCGGVSAGQCTECTNSE